MTSREWGVADASNPYELYSGPMTEAAAYRRVKEWDEHFTAKQGRFRVVACNVGPWMPQAREDAATLYDGVRVSYRVEVGGHDGP